MPKDIILPVYDASSVHYRICWKLYLRTLGKDYPLYVLMERCNELLLRWSILN
jgi:hypothetical protein